MNCLLNAFLFCYAIGVFFYQPLYNIGFYGMIFLILIQYRKGNLRTLFVRFNQKYKLWIVVAAVILMAFLGCFYTVAPKCEAFFIFLRRFLTLSTFLIFIPFFIQNEHFIRKIVRVFILSGMLYCLIAGMHTPHRLRINPIQSSMLIGYILVIFAIQALLIKKDLALNFIRFTFFAIFLCLFNPQKTGIVASIASIASIAKRGTLLFASFLILFALGTYTSTDSCLRLRLFLITMLSKTHCAPLFSHPNTITYDSSSRQRIAMINQSFYILRTSPVWGNGTASYGTVVKTRPLAWISWKYKPGCSDRWITTVHPHNDFCHWCIQFGYLGGILFIMFMGYLFIFFLKQIRIDCLHSFLGLGTVVFFGFCSCCDMMLGSSIPQSIFVLGNSICIAWIVRKTTPFFRKNSNKGNIQFKPSVR